MISFLCLTDLFFFNNILKFIQNFFYTYKNYTNDLIIIKFILPVKIVKNVLRADTRTNMKDQSKQGVRLQYK